ncbi:uncharacterized protein [Palaemon carinicauda]|uniref:uncharacterized protein n=1 Tax=Palaemon carinicauda TaxID=392227 RepID=UPI0035B65404
MEFGKRVPKRKTSCCSTCTLPHEGRERSQRRKRGFNSETEHSKEPAKPKRSTRKTLTNYSEEEETSVSPAEWLSDISVLESVNLLEKPELDTFQIFLSHLDSGIGSNGLEVSDLMSLIGRNCISLGVVRKIAYLLNRDFSSNFCFSFNYFLADEKGMTQIIQSRFPVNQLIMYLCVDRDEDEESYFVDISDNDCKSHFTLAVFDFDSLSLMYADTLGWNMPMNFTYKLKELLSNLNCPSIFHTVLCHPPNDDNFHTCDSECSPLYPLQNCDTASGLAVIVCMVIAFMKYDTYLSLVMGISNEESLYFKYLQDISKYSKLLRLVICSWVVDDCVNFNNIASYDEFMRYPETETSIGYGKQFSNSLLKESKQIHSESSLNIKTEPDLMSSMPESKFNSSGLDELIACRPVVHFCKPDHFRLKLTMKDGRSLYKMFKCTGKGDQAAMYVITEFLNSFKVVEWVRSKTFRNASVIPNTRLRKNKTCNILDFPDDVQGYFIKNPELSFERKIRYLVLRIYVRGCPSVMTKKFRCTTAGKHDGNAIKRINAYINSREFRDLVINNARAEMNLSDEKLNHANFDDLILRKPIIHYIKERSILKLECQLRTGKRIYRGFACSSAGKGDLKTMSVIQKFLVSKEATDWVRSKYEMKLEKKKNQKQKMTPKPPKEDWISNGDLSVGYEVKNFFDKIDFDFRKRIVMAKGVQSLYDGNAIITENEKWGKTHRFDETYMLDPLMAEKGSFPAVTMYISCSSKSSQCKAQCGTPLKDLANTAIGTECPGCHCVLEFPTKECINCSTNSTPKWYSLNGELMCSACYQYQIKHNDSRPTELKMKSAQGVSRLYHSHFVCGWRLKLVIYSNNLSTWKVFKHKDNDDFHSLQVEDIDKKPDISILPGAVLVSKPPKCQKVIIRNKDSKSILCSRCISENSSAPFVCTSQTELMKHISLSHKINFMNCASCWSESGSIVNFENEHELQQHIQENHRAEHPYSRDIVHDRDSDPIETSRQVELDEAVIALLEPSPM